MCSECGAPHVRVVEKVKASHDAEDSGSRKGLHGPTYSRHKTKIEGGQSLVSQSSKTLGWQPSCSCNADTVPAVVLDPFLGSGTVLKVAKQLGRHGIGAELNPEYCEMAVDRIGAQEMLW